MQNPELAHLVETGTDEALAEYLKKFVINHMNIIQQFVNFLLN